MTARDVVEVQGRVFCNRARKAHELARLEVLTGGVRRVSARTLVQGTEGFTILERTFVRSDFDDDLAAMHVAVGCSCGRTFTVDVLAALRGDRLNARRQQPITDMPGVSPHLNRQEPRSIHPNN